MKYIVYAHNYPTLCRALGYIDQKWGRENTVLIYASIVSPLPAKIIEEYSTMIVDGMNRSQLFGVRAIIADIIMAKRSWRALKNSVKGSNDEYVFVVFRDNEAQEATMIDNLFRYYRGRMHLWIIEEGVGLYGISRAKIRKRWIKSIAYKLFGVSQYALTSKPQGMHEKIEKVICWRPNAIKEKFDGKLTVIEKQIDVFTPEFGRHFYSMVTGETITVVSYDYVFITTPIFDLMPNNEESIKKYEIFLDKFLTVAAQSGTVLIKSHPRDFYDYSKYKSARVNICGEIENLIPFECLMKGFGDPRILTIRSSVCINVCGRLPSIYLYELLHVPEMGKDISEQFLKENGIIKCHTYEELKDILLSA